MRRRKSAASRNLEKVTKENRFLEFAEWHCAWLRKLVAKYKERGIYPIFPTQIAEYYQSREDKEIAVMSSLMMDWFRDTELAQITDMRNVMGDSPWRWFCDREFVNLSAFRTSNKLLDGSLYCMYWKLAKFYDMLYDFCYDGYRFILPSEAFRKHSLGDFMDEVCRLFYFKYGRSFAVSIFELYVKSSDGIGCGLWRRGRMSDPSCPKFRGLDKYVKTWFPDYSPTLWSWDEVTALFRLERRYDLCYAYLAYSDLEKVDALACRQYWTRYQSRWESGIMFLKKDWVGERGRQPVIRFADFD